MHYINQFFAGIGGEDKADVPVDCRQGPVGPGKRLQELLGDSAEIVVTAYCGDDYFAEHRDEALASVLKIAKDNNVKIVVAGPAFASGRYGFACAEVCHAVSSSQGLDCVSSMHIDNPGLTMCREYKDRRVFVFPTTEVVSGMEDALSRMAKFVSKLATASRIETPAEEGYIPWGFRREEVVSKSGGARAISILLDKLAGRPFTTEIPVESHERVPVPPRITDLKDLYLALVTTSGVIPPGNPDGLRGYQNTKWGKYTIERLDSMLNAEWDVIHGGYNTDFMKKNPNYGVPLDVVREMEREGVFAKLYPYYYVASGCQAAISAMSRIGKEIATELKTEGIDAAVLVAT